MLLKKSELEDNELFIMYLGKVKLQKSMGSSEAIDAQPFQSGQSSIAVVC